MATEKTLMYHPSGTDVLALSAMWNWRVVLPPNAGVSEKYAAEEFKKYFRQVLQWEPSTDADGFIYIGASPVLDEEEINIDVETVGVRISGGSPRRTAGSRRIF